MLRSSTDCPPSRPAGGVSRGPCRREPPPRTPLPGGASRVLTAAGPEGAAGPVARPRERAVEIFVAPGARSVWICFPAEAAGCSRRLGLRVDPGVGSPHFPPSAVRRGLPPQSHGTLRGLPAPGPVRTGRRPGPAGQAVRLRRRRVDLVAGRRRGAHSPVLCPRRLGRHLPLRALCLSSRLVDRRTGRPAPPAG